MTTSLALLEAEALKLSPEDRAALLERLAASLPVDAEVDAAWDREADRREAALAEGRARLVDGQESLARLRAKLR